MTIQQLLDEKVLRIASLPPGNFSDIESVRSLSVPLIADDYPAKTAVMWNAAYKYIGMSDKNSMMVANPKDATRIMEALRNDPKYCGGGAGIGWKEIVIPYLDEVTPLAKAMGAVNIIKKAEDGQLIGENTDGIGFAESLKSLFGQDWESSSKEILLLGAGGSGKAIAFALGYFGAKVSIVNRTEEKAVLLAEAVNSFFGKALAKGFGRDKIASLVPLADAIVSVIDDSSSPLDAYSTIGPMDLPVSPETVERNLIESAKILEGAKSSLIVSDIRIRKEKTPMLAQAEKLGFRVLDGIPMVVNQGVQAFSFLYNRTLRRRRVHPEGVRQIMRDAIQ